MFLLGATIILILAEISYNYSVVYSVKWFINMVISVSVLLCQPVKCININFTWLRNDAHEKFFLVIVNIQLRIYCRKGHCYLIVSFWRRHRGFTRVGRSLANYLWKFFQSANIILARVTHMLIKPIVNCPMSSFQEDLTIYVKEEGNSTVEN